MRKMEMFIIVIVFIIAILIIINAFLVIYVAAGELFKIWPPVSFHEAETVFSATPGREPECNALSVRPDVPLSQGPSAFSVDSFDNVYILDLFASRILCYDRAGKLRKLISLDFAKRERESELDSLSSLCVIEKGFILLNKTSRKIIFIDFDGKIVKEVSLSMLEGLPGTMWRDLRGKGRIAVTDDTGKVAIFSVRGEYEKLFEDYSLREGIVSDDRLFAYAPGTDMAKASRSLTARILSFSLENGKMEDFALLTRGYPDFRLMVW